MENKIPKGHYCYDDKGTCPYWDIDNTKLYQENGYCNYLGKGDWDLDLSLLWDMVKECRINDEV